MAASVLHRLLWASIAGAVLGTVPVANADILVGVAAPLTGQLEWSGEQTQNEIGLVATELNAAGGLLGQRVVLSFADDHCNAEQAVAAARKLVAAKVVAVIGHQCSGAAIPASEVYEAAHIPFITGSATNPLLTERGLRFTFRAGFRDDAQGSFAAEYMFRQIGVRRIAIVHDSQTYGKGLAEAVRQSLGTLGVPAVLFAALEPGQVEFEDLIERLRQAQVDMLYYGGYQREAGLLRRQLSAVGLTQTLMAGDGIGDEEYPLLAGSAAEGTLMTRGINLRDRPEAREFAARYRAMYSAEPSSAAFRSSSAFAVWTQAVVLARTTDGEAVVDALRRGRFGRFGVPMQFDEKGDMQGPMAEIRLWVWHDGKPVPMARHPAVRPRPSLGDDPVHDWQLSQDRR